HLDERGLGEPRQPARNLGLADAGRPDHQDVLGADLAAQLGRQLLAAPAIAQRHGDGTLGILLAHDVAVEFADDLAGGKVGFGHWSSPGALSRKRTIWCSSINRPFTKRARGSVP